MFHYIVNNNVDVIQTKSDNDYLKSGIGGNKSNHGLDHDAQKQGKSGDVEVTLCAKKTHVRLHLRIQMAIGLSLKIINIQIYFYTIKLVVSIFAFSKIFLESEL